MTDDRKTDVDFGFRRVGEAEKQGLVNEVFSKVAERYDQMNDLMSAGLHRLWKDDFVAMLNPPRGKTAFSVLDVAGGTGDIAFRIARRGGHGTHVTVADISPEMVAEGRKRAEREGLLARCDFTVGNAEALAFPDRSFDAYTIAFGIRNVTHIDRALTTMAWQLTVGCLLASAFVVLHVVSARARLADPRLVDTQLQPEASTGVTAQRVMWYVGTAVPVAVQTVLSPFMLAARLRVACGCGGGSSPSGQRRR